MSQQLFLNKSLHVLCIALQQHWFTVVAMQSQHRYNVRVCVAQIRRKALVQYTTPFTSVNLPTMAEAFKTDVR